MILYLIRHAHAEERMKWSGPDIERPLISKGIDRADRAFNRFVDLYKVPEVIVSSTATRSVQTAEILSSICGAPVEVRQCLNPGAFDDDYFSVISEFGARSPVAIVGHEPDMSDFISHYLSDNKLRLQFKKGSICHLENGFLINLIQQRVLL